MNTDDDKNDQENPVARRSSDPPTSTSGIPAQSAVRSPGDPRHTPGPWTADLSLQRGNQRGGFAIEAGRAGVVICARAGWPGNADESLANARLIAAAPELLDALKAVVVLDTRVHLLAGNRWIAEAIRAAIAKAEGR